MSRSRYPPGPSLFDDLPLSDEAEEEAAAPEELLDLGGEADLQAWEPAEPPQPALPAGREPRSAASTAVEEIALAPRRAGFWLRLQACLVDALALLLAGCLAWLGAFLLGSRPAMAPGLASVPSWGPLLLFLVVFSFTYAVVPLAFWGATPGMLASGLVARSTGGEPLAFDQVARRWLAGWLTVALAGLPLLLGFTRASFADRLSGSRTELA